MSTFPGSARPGTRIRRYLQLTIGLPLLSLMTVTACTTSGTAARSVPSDLSAVTSTSDLTGQPVGSPSPTPDTGGAPAISSGAITTAAPKTLTSNQPSAVSTVSPSPAAGVTRPVLSSDPVRTTLSSPTTTRLTDAEQTTKPAASSPRPPTSAVRQLPSFRLPSGNIGCTFGQNAAGAAVTCAIGTHSIDESRFDCPSGQRFTHLVVFDRRGVHVGCGTGGPATVPNGPTLEYGQAVSAGFLSCRSAEGGLSCSDALERSGFVLSRTSWTRGNGEGGGRVLVFPAGSKRAVVDKDFDRYWFQSADHSVSCVALAISSTSNVYCVPTKGSFPTPANALSCNAGGLPVAILDDFGVGAATSVACAGKVGVQGILGSDAVAEAVFPLDGTVVVGRSSCTIEQSAVSCRSAGGFTGFRVTAKSYLTLVS